MNTQTPAYIRPTIVMNDAFLLSAGPAVSFDRVGPSPIMYFFLALDPGPGYILQDELPPGGGRLIWN